MLVMKFGGTSVADAIAMKRVCDIIKSDNRSKKLIVLSACKGITNLLTEIALLSAQGNNILKNKKIEQLLSFHLEICEEGISNSELKEQTKLKIEKRIDELKNLCEGIYLLNDLTEFSNTKLIINGEMLSSTIFSAILEDNNIANSLMNAKDVIIRIGEKNHISYEVNTKIIEQNFKKSNTVLTQGFIGSDTKGNAISLGRGGSDYSASLIGSAIDSEEIQIWSDVSGVLSGDPNLLVNTKTIQSLSFMQVRELAYYGVQALHTDAIKPAIEKNIEVRMLNTYKPEDAGTLIKSKIVDSIKLRSVIKLEGCVICKLEFDFDSNHLIKKIEVLEFIIKHNVKVYNIFSTEHEVKIIIREEDLEKIQSFQINFEYEYLDLLIIIGQDISKILNILDSENLNSKVLYGLNEYGFMIMSKAEESMDLYRKVHNVIVD